MLVLEWLADLLLSTLGGLISEPVRQRRAAAMTRKRFVAFDAGHEVRIPCALRHVHDGTTRWRHGRLRLVKGRAAWAPRWHREPSVTFNRTTAVGQRGRRVGGRESLSINPRLTVLSYRVADDVIEIAVRKRDLAILGRVVGLPPTSV
jgi:hypothetical protein